MKAVANFAVAAFRVFAGLGAAGSVKAAVTLVTAPERVVAVYRGGLPTGAIRALTALAVTQIALGAWVAYAPSRAGVAGLLGCGVATLAADLGWRGPRIHVIVASIFLALLGPLAALAWPHLH